ncbi:MAG: calcium-binding protein [Pirellulaceae bacterium]
MQSIFGGTESADALFFDVNELQIYGQLSGNASVAFEFGMLRALWRTERWALDSQIDFAFVDDAEGADVVRNSLTQLTAGNFTSLFDITFPSASFSANLPVSVSLGDVDLSSANPAIAISDADVFADPLPTVTLENFDDLLGFNLIGPQQVLGMLTGAATVLRQYTNSPALDIDIPFTDSSVGSFLDASLALTRHLNRTNPGPLSINSGPLASGVNDTGSLTNDLSMLISLDGGTQVELSLAASLTGSNTETANLLSQLNALLTGTSLEGKLIFAANDKVIALKTVDGVSATSIRIYVPTETANGATEAGFSTSLVRTESESKFDKLIPQALAVKGNNVDEQIATTGQLTQDAVFSIVYDNGTAIPITVTVAETASHASPTDLLATLNSKLTGTAVETKIEFTYDEDREVFALSTKTDVTGVGLELLATNTDGTNGITELGLLNVLPQFATTFDTWEEYLPLLAEVLGISDGGNSLTFEYDSDAHELLFSLNLSQTMDELTVPFGFDVSLDPIAGLHAQGSMNVNGSANLGVTLGIDVSDASFFLDDLTVGGNMQLSVNDFSAGAKFGFIDIAIGDASATVTASPSFSLSSSDGNRLTFDEIWTSLTGASPTEYIDVSMAGSASLTMTGITDSTGMLGALTAGANQTPNITLSIADLLDPSSIDVSTNLAQLSDLSNIRLTTIVNMLRAAHNYLSATEELSFLDAKLPLVNRSPSQFLNSAAKIAAAIDKMEQDPAAGLTAVELAIEEALSLGTEAVSFNLVPSGDGGYDALELAITLSNTYNQQVPFNVDLQGLAALTGNAAVQQLVSSAKSLVGVGASGQFTLMMSPTFTLALGVDLTNSASPAPYLAESTGFSFNVKAAAEDLTFNASIGPVSLEVFDGIAALDEDGDPTTDDSASIFVNVNGGDDDRLYLSEMTADQFSFTSLLTPGITGGIGANLPLKFAGIPIGPARIQIPDIMAFINGDIGSVTMSIPDFQEVLLQNGIMAVLKNPTILIDGMDSLLTQLQSGLDTVIDTVNLPIIGEQLSSGTNFVSSQIRANLLDPLRAVGHLFDVDVLDSSLISELNGVRPALPSMLATAFANHNITLSEYARISVVTPSSVWNVIDGENAYEIKWAEIDLTPLQPGDSLHAIIVSDIAEGIPDPLFTTSAPTEQTITDLITNLSPTIPSQVVSALTAQGITLGGSADISEDAGNLNEWTITDGNDSYPVVIDKSHGVDVLIVNGQVIPDLLTSAEFTILDGVAPSLSSTIEDAFETNEQTLPAEYSIKVVGSNEWRISTSENNYTLRYTDNKIQVFDAEVDAVELIKHVIFDTFGPSGANILLKYDPADGEFAAATSVNDVKIFTFDGDGEKSELTQIPDTLEGYQDFTGVQFGVRFGQGLASVALPTDFDFDLGLPGFPLGLELNGGLQFDLGWSLAMGFGVTEDDGFFFDSSSEKELNVGISVNMTSPTNASEPWATGSLGFLEAKARLISGQSNGISGSVGVDVADPNDDGKLTFTELSQGNFQFFVPKANVNLNLNLDTEFGTAGISGMPRLYADVSLGWVWSPTSETGAPNAPTFAVNNVELDVGAFVSQFLSPVITEVNNVIDPVRPLLDALGARIPGLSEIAGEDVSLLNLGDKLGNGNFSTGPVRGHFYNVAQFLSRISGVANVINKVSEAVTELNGQTQVIIPLGSFTLSDPLSAGASPNSSGTAQDPMQNALNLNKPKLSAMLNALKDANSGFAFPLLTNPMAAFQLITGKDIELFTFDTPRLDIGFQIDVGFDLEDVVGVDLPISASLYLRGGFDIDAHFGFGYDTTGFRTFVNSGMQNFGAIFDGFYVSDRYNSNGTGDDVKEIDIRGSIEVQGGVSLALLRAVLGGNMSFSGSLDLNDPNNDGKLRPSEIANQGLLSSLNLKAKLSGGANVGVDVWNPFANWHHKSKWGIPYFWYPSGRWEDVFDASWGPTTFFEIDTTQTPPNPMLARVESGKLILNMGPDAYRRGVSNKSDGSEVFTVRQASGDGNTGTIEVSAFGYVQSFSNVSSILAKGGEADDSISLVGVKIATTLEGGNGNDQLRADGATSAALTLSGDGGNDVLEGGSGADTLKGGAGNDTLKGFGGNDTLEGENDNDSLLGGDGNDTLRGGSGNDTLVGENHDDELHGDAGDDALYGSSGNDVLRGGDNNDSLHGEDGNDQLFGDNHVDTAYGGNGNDTLYGGNDNDALYGGNDDDSLYGDAGADTLSGELGNDVLYGGTENDVLDGADGNDSLYGEGGNDTLRGRLGSDMLDGGDGDDTLSGDEHDDTLYGQAGNDSLSGDSGNDRLFGNDGADTLSGSSGDDSLEGGSGNDSLYGHSGNDSLFGQAGDDQLWGDIGNDFLQGNEDNDRLFGQDGDDTIQGNLGNDSIEGGSGNDHLTGHEGNDTIYGHSGADTIWGSSGDDILHGNEDNDTIYGEDGADTIHGNLGNDSIEGGSGNDSIIGHEGNDSIFGHAGNDSIWGSSGDDTIHGDEDNDSIYGEDGNDTPSKEPRQRCHPRKRGE